MQRKWQTRTPAAIARTWDYDCVIHDGDAFFDALERAIDGARTSVQAEFYIFADDKTGNRIFAALSRAVERGVRVRLMVDGIGSAGWTRAWEERARAARISFKIYHELPWEVLFGAKRFGPRRRKVWDLLRRINNRDHRKVCIIDYETAFVGSMNVIDYHVPSISGEKAWRDTGAIVRGADVSALIQSFERVWLGSLRSLQERLRRTRKRPQSSQLVRLNLRVRQRHDNYVDLLTRIIRAKQRILITNAYFVPDSSLLRVLATAVKTGVQVRILMPRVSDVFFIPWVSAALQFALLELRLIGPLLEPGPMLVVLAEHLLEKHHVGLQGSDRLAHRGQDERPVTDIEAFVNVV